TGRVTYYEEGKPIKQIGETKLKTPTEKTVYDSGNQYYGVGKYNGREFTTDAYLLEFGKVGKAEFKESLNQAAKPILDKINEIKTILSKPVGYVDLYGNKNGIAFKVGRQDVVINSRYYNYLSKKYKNLELRGINAESPIAIYDGKQIKGMVMPTKSDLPIKPLKANIKEPAPGKAVGFAEPQTTTETIFPKMEVIEGTMSQGAIKPVELPELVRFVQGEGMDIFLKNYKKYLGMFYGEKIGLNPKIFKNTADATKVLAHEVGHWIDWMPEHILKRGNLLGRLLSLQKHLKDTFGDLGISNKQIRNELISFVKKWLYGDNPPEKLSKYNLQSRELYADALSGILTNPGMVEKIAPTFYEKFFEFLDRKPEVKEAFFDLQHLLRGTGEQIDAVRLDGIYKGYAKARGRRIQIQGELKEKMELNKKRWLERAIQKHVTKWEPIYKRLSEAGYKQLGVEASKLDEMRMNLEELSMVNNDLRLFFEAVDKDIVSALKGIGISEDAFGAYMEFERNITQRENIANPGGMQKEFAEKGIAYLEKEFGDRTEVVRQIIKNFHDKVFNIVEEAKNQGIFSDEVFKEKIAPHKDTYVTYQVVDYIDKNYVAPGLKTMRGTLGAIENPFVSTILKMSSLIELIAEQKAKNNFISTWREIFSGEVFQSEKIRIDGKPTGRFRVRNDYGRIELYEGGKWNGYDVDPYIAEAFNSRPPQDMHAILQGLQMFNRVFKQVVTTYNVSWGFYSNIWRDTKRTIRNLKSITRGVYGKEVSIAEYLYNYFKSLPESRKLAKGEIDSLGKEMLENKAYSSTFIQYNPFANNETALRPIFEKYKYLGELPQEIGKRSWFGELTEKVKTNIIGKLIGRVLKGIQYGGSILEANTKVASYQILKKRDANAKRVGLFVRNYAGTPNFLDGGTMKYIDNNVAVFSNVILQGLRSELELMKAPTTRGGYFMWLFLMDIAPKIAMLGASAGLFGATLKKAYEKMTEYDKTNYLTIPVGFTKEDKVVYFRIPQDEMGRFFSGIIWKTGSYLTGQGKGIDGIVSLGSDMTPSISPLIALSSAWLQYAVGKNPYDFFRGR
ncbi:MAG: hypothetical protein WC269_06240, partial [Candidatus Gracilibacteria bacterium]